MRTLLLPLMVLFLVSCQEPRVRPDPAPSPVDRQINQARLEFKGCGRDNQIGTLSCTRNQQAVAITEWTGKLTFSSSGAGCSMREDIAVTQRETPIPVPRAPAGTSCAVIVIYLPEFPNKPGSVPTRSLFGEVIYQPDARYAYRGNYALSTFETLDLEFPGAVRGAIASRQWEDPIAFNGDTFSFSPRNKGTDLILVKLWDKDGNNFYRSYTANYYAPQAQRLTYTRQTDSQGRHVVTFPDSVSVITINGKHTFDLQITLPKGFTGFVRAYTAQGRTRVLKFNNGAFQWAK